MSAEDDERREKLAATAMLLTAEIAKMNNQLRDTSIRVSQLVARNELLDQRAKRHSNWIYATAAGLALSLGACIVLTIVVTGNRERDERLEASVREQCAFNALILGSYRPESRPAGPQRDQYEAGFARMRESYRVLGCAEPIVPPMPR